MESPKEDIKIITHFSDFSNIRPSVSKDSKNSYIQEENARLNTPRLRHVRESETKVYDDQTISILWEAHTISVIVLGLSLLFYFAFYKSFENNMVANVKQGMVGMLCTFLVFGILMTQNGPIIRPHPVFWRLMFCLCCAYELLLVFFLFQTVSDARSFLAFVDPNLNKPLEFKSYGEHTCTIWDPGHPNGAFHNVMDKMDIFVFAHLFGWFWKALIFRDMYITNSISFLFELMEYTFQYQLPNFYECWWDHWVLDFIVCNGLGIYLGLTCLKYLSIKEYTWTSLWNIRTYKGKMKRVVGQFTPYSWVQFNWKPTANLYRWLAVSVIVFFSLLAELNTFYLKFVLWISPDHPLVTLRLVLYALCAFVGVREAYDYAGGKSKTFGQQVSLLVSVIMTEFMIVCKFDWKTLTKPCPTHVKYFWATAFVAYILFSMWKFQIKFPLVRQWMRNKLRELINSEVVQNSLNGNRPPNSTTSSSESD